MRDPVSPKPFHAANLTGTALGIAGLISYIVVVIKNPEARTLLPILGLISITAIVVAWREIKESPGLVVAALFAESLFSFVYEVQESLATHSTPIGIKLATYIGATIIIAMSVPFTFCATRATVDQALGKHDHHA